MDHQQLYSLQLVLVINSYLKWFRLIHKKVKLVKTLIHLSFCCCYKDCRGTGEANALNSLVIGDKVLLCNRKSETDKYLSFMLSYSSPNRLHHLQKCLSTPYLSFTNIPNF